MNWNKKNIRSFGFLLGLFLALFPFIAKAQGPVLPFPITPSFNTFNNNQQSFDLGDPTNMQQTIEYDPETGHYVFKQTVGEGLLFRNPTGMTLDEYLNYKNKQFEGQNWEQQIEEESVVGRSFELPIKVGKSI